MSPDCEVAIVGIGGIFPSPPQPPAEAGPGPLSRFWSLVAHAVDSAREPPADRWLLPVEQAFDPTPGRPDRVYSRRACFVDAAEIDEAGLSRATGLTQARLSSFDMSARLALRAAVDAWADAQTSALDGDRVGVVLGNLVLPSEHSSNVAQWILGRHFERGLFAQAGLAPPRATRAPVSIERAEDPASVVARALGLGGAHTCLDAACASSLFALEHAVGELRRGRADAMLAGGLARPDALFTQMGFCQLRALSARGRCAPFDQTADGIVVGEGAGVLLLKRLDDALAAGDRVYALVRGIGLSNDVDGNLLAPSEPGQLRAMRGALAQAGWRSTDVDLIECHATGTPIGDRVEHDSLRALWTDQSWRPGQCVIGSVKSNVGHLLTGAGAASLIKVLLALKHELVPPTANFTRAPDPMALDAGPFRVAARLEPWPRRARELPRRAAVSGFGFGGTNAHVLLEEHRPTARRDRVSVAREFHAPASSPPPALPQADPRSDAAMDVAIVGLGVAVGPFEDLDAFGRHVFAGKPSGATPQPKEGYWGLEDPPPGWFIEQLAIPVGAYRIPPKEIEASLPQQMLMLELARRAMLDAELLPNARSSRRSTPEQLRTGVYVGLELDFNTTNYHLRWIIGARARAWARELGLELDDAALVRWTDSLCERVGPALDANRTIGGLGSIVASRIAREFGFGGPSYVLCSGESSGISALQAALQALEAGQIDRALVGAVDLTGDVRALLADDLARPRSPNGRVKPFHRDADGSLPSDAAVALVLERHDDARRAARRCYARVRGLGLAAGSHLEASYLAAVRRAHASAGVGPRQVGYVEAHGEGRIDRDLAEARALQRAYGPEARPPADDAAASDPLVIGTTKDHVGHAGAAAGLLSVAKAALSLYHRALAPTKAEGPPLADLEPLRLLKAPQPWVYDAADGLPVAGVSCISSAGQCAHVLLQGSADAPRPSEQRHVRPPDSEALFVLDGATVDQLVASLRELERWATAAGERPIDALARSWWRQHQERPSSDVTRSPRSAAMATPAESARLALVARNATDLARLVRDAASALERGAAPRTGASEERLFFTPERLGGELAFVFPGSGTEHPGMGRELALRLPELLRSQQGDVGRLRSQLLPQAIWQDDLPDDPRLAISSLVSVGTLLSDGVRRFGIEPSAVIGYSLGESTGLFALGAWQQRDEMLQRVARSDLFERQLAGPCEAARRCWGLSPSDEVRWHVGVVDRPAECVRRLLAGRARVYLLIVNAPDECVIGGDQAAVEALITELACRFVPLRGVTTVHCEIARQVAADYRALHLLETRAPAGIRFYSAARGTVYRVDHDSAADAIVAQATDTVDFAGLIEHAWHDGVRLFVEIGPGRSCTRMIARILRDRPHRARSACAGGPNEVGSLLRLLGLAWSEGLAIDLEPLYGSVSGPAPAVHPAAPSAAIRLTTGRDALTFHDLLPRRQPSPARPTPPKPTAPSQPMLADGITTLAAGRARAHAGYLQLAARIEQIAARQAAFQLELARRLPAQRIPLGDPPPVRLDRPACLEFARGSIASALGPEFAPVDQHPTRVRLPDEPLMLVDRVLEISGRPLSLTSGRIVTEHDVRPHAWYLDRGRIPTCIAVEAGQADLMLSAYLGIDFQTRGHAVYRLLDATVVFHDALPVAGDTIRYEIAIDRFERQDDIWLFWFHFDASVGGRALMSMRDGCAGFFSHAHLAAGQGVVRGRIASGPAGQTPSGDAIALVPIEDGALGPTQLHALRRGDLAGAFGGPFSDLPSGDRSLLPDGKMHLVDRVTHLEPRGGLYGLGRVRAEADIVPDAWFLTCHFLDDRVMPGTLMYECCLHTLRIFLLRLGWVPPTDQVTYQPKIGRRSRLKCRGQVLEQTEVVAYDISIKELGYDPEPYAIADATMIADGKPIVDIGDMSLRLGGTRRDEIEALWRGARTLARRARGGTGPKAARYDRDKIEQFAMGQPSKAFGAPYAPFDAERTIARLPRPPFLFIDRITEVEGAPFEMTAGASCEAQVAVSPRAWCVTSNRQRHLPFAVLLEMALQPCGWLAAYVGSALSSPTDLRFRNLGGAARLLAEVPAEDDLLTTRAQLTHVSQSAGMIIQHYAFSTSSQRRGPVYEGTTYFGFFSDEALANQRGIEHARRFEAATGGVEPFEMPRRSPFPDHQLRMIDHVELYLPDGGAHGLGFIRGSIGVDPSAWFFAAHFYQDPVWPGSLGLEGCLQLLKLVACDRFAEPEPAFSTMPCGVEHRWTYRGQIIPTHERVEIEATVSAVDADRQQLLADGYVSVDGRAIYELNDFGIAITAR